MADEKKEPSSDSLDAAVHKAHDELNKLTEGVASGKVSKEDAVDAQLAIEVMNAELAEVTSKVGPAPGQA